MIGFQMTRFDLRVSNWLIVILLFVDQAICLACTFRTPVGASKARPDGLKAWQIAYGFMNCKTYTLLMLLQLRDQSAINLLIWSADAALGLSSKVSEWLCTSSVLPNWMVLFYSAHRTCHVPCVYEQAHRFHHYLHDATAFDAHIYGSGLPEEWFLLALEMALGVQGVTPMSLGYHVLMQSFSNKVGHTRKENGDGGINHHADHHIAHNKNFGIYTPLTDLLFGTNYPDENSQQHKDHMIRKELCDGQVNLICTPAVSKWDASSDYYDADPVVAFKKVLMARVQIFKGLSKLSVPIS